jgi:sugar lactone lactonase YvrE
METQGVTRVPFDGYADGPSMDEAGVLHVGLFNGWGVARFSPEGERIGAIRLPVQTVTKAAFGGDDLRTLYITTSRQNRPAEELAREPWAGQVLHCRVEVPGLPVNFAHV